jgi:hypothetical protein
MWRSFEPQVEMHAADCVTRQVSTEPFTIVGGGLVGGGSQAAQVMLGSGLTPFAKPARPQPGDVAREWLAFVLGHTLGLPVSSVLISRQTAGLVPALPPVVALSFEMLPQGRPWAQFNPTAAELVSLRPIFSAMFAFHAWIGEQDHFGVTNMLAERIAGGIVRLAFFDYSMSLTYNWTPPAAMPIRPEWRTPPGPYANPDPLVMEQVIDHISKLFPLSGLQSIIAAIPPDCLPAADGTALADGLFDRAKQLKTVLGIP